MILKTTFKKLKPDSLFEFGNDYFVKLNKKSAKMISTQVPYNFSGKEEVIADNARIKKWYQF
ncbi:hypothetical protein KNT81_gp196 [Proteus phage phiP4-3]|uniref:Uncharacterized protein n=1 Tax=Proteus phage phiP4-3 TaxID=2065203 RepID=A0A2I6PFQ7_9CAUD|nr:hypothetical protein KNT81_gp196 [Proteus phage phiP4-3]AUM58575.1 hypothetical protein phiP43_217 [Proteus phage phiP4-3]AZV01185.1 hypothetical protein vBSdyM006_048 [Shigella phage vB_SdyM_006]